MCIYSVKHLCFSQILLQNIIRGHQCLQVPKKDTHSCHIRSFTGCLEFHCNTAGMMHHIQKLWSGTCALFSQLSISDPHSTIDQRGYISRSYCWSQMLVRMEGNRSYTKALLSSTSQLCSLPQSRDFSQFSTAGVPLGTKPRTEAFTHGSFRTKTYSRWDKL